MENAGKRNNSLGEKSRLQGKEWEKTEQSASEKQEKRNTSTSFQKHERNHYPCIWQGCTAVVKQPSRHGKCIHALCDKMAAFARGSMKLMDRGPLQPAIAASQNEKKSQYLWFIRNWNNRFCWMFATQRMLFLLVHWLRQITLDTFKWFSLVYLVFVGSCTILRHQL